MTHEQLTMGAGGWVRWLRDDDIAYLRFVENSGRLALAELYFPTATTARAIKRFPLTRIEAWVNRPDVAEIIRMRLDLPRPLLDVAISYFTTSGNPVASPGWVGDMLRSQHPHWGVPRVEVKRVPLLGEHRTPVDPHLDVPAQRPYGDDFYRAVAKVYSGLAVDDRAPAATIADANGVAVTQVHRWIRVARDLGFLPPGTKGKRG